MSNRIKLRQLRAYQAIMSSGSVTGAAGRLNTTQPAVSKHLAALEEAIGMRLFIRRRGGPMKPTHAGVKFYKSIEGTLSGIDNIANIAREITDHSSARLRIAGTEPLINSQFLAGALTRFKSTNPNVRFSLDSRHRLDIEEWVVSRQADFGLALLPVGNPLISTHAFITTPAVAIVHKDHRLASKNAISPADLVEERLILPGRQPLRTQIDLAFASRETFFNIDIEASSIMTCCRFAAEGFGIAICDPFTPTAFQDTRIRVLKWEPEVLLTYGALLNKDDERSEVIDQLLTCIKEELDVQGF